MARHRNYINGEWIDGSETTVNVNPSDLDDTIGEYAEADGARSRMPSPRPRQPL